MQKGTIISATGHGILIAFVIFGLPERDHDRDPMRAQISDVSIVSLAEFEAARSSAPDETSAAADAPVAPTEDNMPDKVAEADSKPIVPMADVPDAPQTETAPDTSGLDIAQPSVSTDVDAPTAELDAGQIGLDTPLIDAAPQDGSANSTQTAMLTPARPNHAPRIDTTAAPKPPEPVKEAETAQEDTAPDASDAPPVEEQPQEAAAPKESATETVPDAKPEERPTTPLAAARPRGRPANLEAKAEQRRKAEQDAIAAALAAAQADTPKPVSEPAPQGSRLGGNFNSAQSQAVGDAVGRFWNKTLIEGKDGYEKLVVTVRVKLTAAGKIIGGVDPVEPSSPQGDYKVAYEAARRAVMRAQPIPLPQDLFRDGDYLEIRFDPGRSAISLN